jgi:PIN domain nuclease of toxin-antitoxin system
MKYLIDSHVLLWLIAESHKVGLSAKRALQDPDAQVCVSVVSLWELNLKAEKGRLPISADQILSGLELLGVETLGMTMQHIISFGEVHIEHTDPFDVMLCAQAKAENMTLVTADKTLLEKFSASINACE